MQLYLEFCARLERGVSSMSLKVPDVEQIEFDDIESFSSHLQVVFRM